MKEIVNNSDKMGVLGRSGGGRINYLDAIKCLGIILVIEGHVRLFGMKIETYDTLSGLMLYSFNMPLFFFVSGFLAYKERMTYDETRKKIWQKFVYLVIPAFVFYVFRSILDQGSPTDFFTKGSGGYWFTITLWECFFLYYLVIIIVKMHHWQDVALVILALGGVVFLSIVGDYGPKLLDLNRLTKYFQFFVVGVLAMKYRSKFEKVVNCDWLKTVMAIGFFALLFVINKNNLPSPVFHLLRDIVLRYMGTFAVVSWFVCNSEHFNSDSRCNKILKDIGRKSLAIYLLQYFFLPNFTSFFSGFDGLDGFTMHVVSFASTIVVLAICYAFISLLSNSRLLKRYVLGQK